MRVTMMVAARVEQRGNCKGEMKDMKVIRVT